MSYWGPDSGEGDFVFHKGHLLAGCLDKAQFGKFGLVHAMQVQGLKKRRDYYFSMGRGCCAIVEFVL